MWVDRCDDLHQFALLPRGVKEDAEIGQVHGGKRMTARPGLDCASGARLRVRG
jgi:hypothetical protein